MERKRRHRTSLQPVSDIIYRCRYGDPQLFLATIGIVSSIVVPETSHSSLSDGARESRLVQIEEGEFVRAEKIAIWLRLYSSPQFEHNGVE